ncbi:MAG: MobC family plasmid mobilization relaxosome protein [Clostridiales bacterium]|nr:MobC family plasmid mobilization relaxosome protein [Clostridiales bacterium]
MKKKSEILHIRLTAEEKEAIKEKMKTVGMTNMSKFVRLALEVNPVVSLDMNGIYKLAYEVNRIGNNINQIAKHVNTTRNLYKNELDNIANELHQLNHFINLIKEKIQQSGSKEA